MTMIDKINRYSVSENAFIGAAGQALFQRPAFFRIHAQIGGSYFELLHKGQSKASIHFTPVDRDGTWRSPARGTFAGLSAVEDIKHSELFTFIDAIESALKSKGASALEVLLAPQAHDGAFFARQTYLFKSRGYETIRCDLNQSLEIDGRSLSDHMSYGNIKRLRKCTRDGFGARQLPTSQLPGVYQTLAENRASKGYRLSMTLEQLQAMVDTFPEDVILFGCGGKEQFAAAALCLRLSPAILYVFYWGDRPEYATYSPVVAIADAIYRFAQQQGYKILDVGTSTVDRVPNFGLLEFKRNLGFCDSLKLTMRKSL